MPVGPTAKMAVLQRGRAEALVPPGSSDLGTVLFFRRGRCCGARGVRNSRATVAVNAIGRALSKRLEREKARMN